MGRVGLGIDGIGDDIGPRQTRHRINIILAHGHIDDGSLTVLAVHQVGGQCSGVLKAEFLGSLRHSHAQELLVFGPDHAADDDAVPAQRDAEVVPVIVQHAAGTAELLHTFGGAQFFQCTGHVAGHEHRGQHGGQGRAAALVGVEVHGHVHALGAGGFDVGNGGVDVLAPVLHAAALEVADLQGTAHAAGDLDHLAHALYHAVALTADVGGDDPVIPAHRLQNVGKFIGGGIALRQVHDAQRHTGSTGGHGVLDQSTGVVQLLLGVGSVGKALDADLDGAGADHGGNIQGQRGLVQGSQIITVGVGAVQADGAHDGFFKGIILLCRLVRFRARGHADAAVACHCRGNALGQLHLAKVRVIEGLCVVVTVDIHKPRGHHLAGGVDDLVCRLCDARSDLGNTVVLHQQVCLVGLAPQAVV